MKKRVYRKRYNQEVKEIKEEKPKKQTKKGDK